MSVTSDPVLELRNVTKRFGDVVAVDTVSLTLNHGEFLTFLGPSGSGKTTTLMMVAGLQSPSGGEILMRGDPLVPLPPYRRNIGMVFQHYALFPHMTVAANIAFPLEMRRVRMAEIRRRVDNVLRLVGLPDMGKRTPAQLSGGQQQRVALARAIVFEPPLLLMDEPLGALDRKLREQMQIELSRLHRELSMTVLYVTHDQEEALTMSDRIAVFRNGRIEQVGTPRDLYEHPASRFVADFLGESSFFPGVVHATVNGVAVVETAHGLLRGKFAAGVAADAPAILAVRPERVVLGDELAAADNVISGTIKDLVYLGQSCKSVIRLADGSELVVLQPAAVFERQSLASGDTVRASWSSSDCTVLPADE
jgi:putative spermidine/putrescine transport system ATP-binding protein